MSWNRILSGSLAPGYIVFGFATGRAQGGFIFGAFSILPLACIWFSKEMGNYTGLSGDIWITAPSPGIFVCIAGWILLLLPILIPVISYLG